MGIGTFGGMIGSLFAFCALEGGGPPARSAKPVTGRKPPAETAEDNRTAAVIKLASRLVNLLEKGESGETFIELYKLSPADRVPVAEKMLWLNRQHRSIIESLPCFECSFITLHDGQRDLACIEISVTGAGGKVTNNTFSFHARKRRKLATSSQSGAISCYGAPALKEQER